MNMSMIVIVKGFKLGKYLNQQNLKCKVWHVAYVGEFKQELFFVYLRLVFSMYIFSVRLQNRCVGPVWNLPTCRPQPATYSERKLQFNVILVGRPAVYFSRWLIYETPIVNGWRELSFFLLLILMNITSFYLDPNAISDIYIYFLSPKKFEL